MKLLSYWALIFISAVAIGAGAFWLLVRESQHLETARRETLNQELRVIAGNIELAFEELKKELIDGVTQLPRDANIDQWLEDWERANPYVTKTYTRIPSVQKESDSLQAPIQAAPEKSKIAPPTVQEARSKKDFGGQYEQSIRSRRSIQSKVRSATEMAFQNSIAVAPEKELRIQEEAIVSMDTPLGEALVDKDLGDTFMDFGGTEATSAPQMAQPMTARSIKPSVSSKTGTAEIREVTSLLDNTESASIPLSKDTITPLRAYSDKTTSQPMATFVERWKAMPELVGSVSYSDGFEVGFTVKTDAIIELIGAALPGPDRQSGRSSEYSLYSENTLLKNFQENKNMYSDYEYISGKTAGLSNSINTTLPLNSILPSWELRVTRFHSFNPAMVLYTGGGLTLILFLLCVLGGTLLLRQARRDATEALQKTTFVANVSHELKTPLTTIRMYAELLRDGRIHDEVKKSDYLATIENETQRLTRIINNVLSFSRQERKQLVYKNAVLNITDMLNTLLDQQFLRLEEAGIVLERQFPDSPVVIKSDVDAWEQVVLNLLDNALKYGADGKWIGVSLRNQDGCGFELSIADKGPGIPAKVQSRIFEAFFRADDSLTSNQAGTGLGLSIVQRTLDDLGATVKYQPEKPHGARFIINYKKS